MDSLAKSVKQTLKNLQEKKEFLQVQRDRYIDIRQRVLRYEADEVDQLEGGTMEVLGDVIISPRKMFVNIGLEYYVEKTKDELLSYAEEKRKLIEQAIEQFDLKIRNGEKALKSFDMLSQSEEDPVGSENAEDEQVDSFPSMEIREELDEEGNVISSSVTPTMSSLRHENSVEDDEEYPKTGLNDFEQNIKGRLIEKAPQQEKEHTSSLGFSEDGALSTENMYTFADLVRQLDEQDELDNEVDSGEVGYDFESFDRSYSTESGLNGGESHGQITEINTDDEASEDEDDQDSDVDGGENHYMIAPTVEAHSAFMDQLRKLREKKSENRVAEQVKEPAKSILKKSSTDKKKAKKSVGFAPKLDVHEVENLKQENRRNRHSLSPFMHSLDHVSEEETSSNSEFDSDLFAQLIGARGPDEIHDRYKSEAENVEEKSTTTSLNQRKKTSRFKQERKSRTSESFNDSSSFFTSSTSDHVIENTISENELPPSSDLDETHNSTSLDGHADIDRDANLSVVADSIIERDLDEAPVSTTILTSKVNEPAVQELLAEKDTDQLVMKDAIVEREFEEPTIAGQIVERGTNEIPSVSAAANATRNPKAVRDESAETTDNQPGRPNKASAFSKRMKSLQRSTKSKNTSRDLAYEFSDSSDDLSDTSSSSDGQKFDSKPQSSPETFPAEVMQEIGGTSNPISLPKVDYSALGDNLDDMVKAYSLGIYDDDLDEDPGMLLEKIDDFKQYNEQVEVLRNDIQAFKMNHPMEEITDNHQLSDEDGPLVSEIKENNYPESYDEVNPDDDLALESHRLNESIAIEYSRMREVISNNSSLFSGGMCGCQDENKQIEPINEHGEPIKVSRFRSQRPRAVGKGYI